MRLCSTFLLLSCHLLGLNENVQGGRTYKQTKGEMWPWPQFQETYPEYYVYSRYNFLVVFGENFFEECWVRDELFSRFPVLVNSLYEVAQLWTPEDNENSANSTGLKSVTFKLGPGASALDCPEVVPADMNESYTINITTENATVEAYSVWGLMRAVVSFEQLFYIEEEAHEVRVNRTYIEDYPQYGYRGFLLDTSRHYISTSKIKDLIFALSLNKINVLHWHMTDDDSFPYRSKHFPELSAKGAFHEVATYKKSDVDHIIAAGLVKGMRVIPEFNIPGHTKSWGRAFSELLTMCNGTNQGPINFLHKNAFEFLKIFFTEARSIFVDTYFHLGGSDVDLDCWTRNPDYQKYMEEHNFTTGQELLEDFMTKMIDILKNINNRGRLILWEDVVADGMELPKRSLVQVYKPDSLNDVLSLGYNVIFSSCFQYDSSQKQNHFFADFYLCIPEDNVTNKTLLNQLVGGEVVVWSGRLDDTNINSKIWPRTMCAAERLWSSNSTLPPGLPYGRADEQTCRMKTLGLHPLPVYAGYCLGEKLYYRK